MTPERRAELIERIAASFRAIGQPDTSGLIFVCDSEDEFAELGETILGIPVYSCPFLSIRGGLLLVGRQGKWGELGYKMVKFQEEMDI